MNKLWNTLLLFALLGTAGCDKKMDTLPVYPPQEPVPPPEVVIPDTLTVIPDDTLPDEEKLIAPVEIKDFQTKLYFLVPWPEGVMGPLCAMVPDGIRYAKKTGIASFTDSIYRDVRIRNFPDYAVNWNPEEEPKPIVCTWFEGELDVIISGIIYREETTRYLELTSIEKITP
jgi:hypothetical protein